MGHRPVRLAHTSAPDPESMNLMRPLSSPCGTWRLLALVLIATLASCGTVRTNRVIDVREPPAGVAMLAPEQEPTAFGERWLLETKYVYYRTLKISVWTASDLEQVAREAVEEELGYEVDEFELVSAKWERVWGILRANHDFVVRARVVASEHGISGEFEGTVTGDELLHAYRIFGEDLESELPFTNLDPDRTDLPYRLERSADRGAWRLRMCLRLAIERLALRVR